MSVPLEQRSWRFSDDAHLNTFQCKHMLSRKHFKQARRKETTSKMGKNTTTY